MAETRRSKGTGSVEQLYKTVDGVRSSAGYKAKYRVPHSGGKVRTRNFRFKYEAEAWLAGEAQKYGVNVPDTGDTLIGYLEWYEEFVLPTLNIAPGTKDTRKRLFANPIKPAIEGYTFQRFPDKVYEFLARLNEARTTRPQKKNKKGKRPEPPPLSDDTKYQAFVVLRQVLDHAVTRGVIEVNPLRAVDPPRVEKKEAPYLGKEQVDVALMREIERHYTHNPMLCTLVTLLAFTGMRLGEALGLRWNDVDTQFEVVTVRRSGPDTDRPKSGPSRSPGLPAPAIAVMKLWAVHQGVIGDDSSTADKYKNLNEDERDALGDEWAEQELQKSLLTDYRRNPNMGLGEFSDMDAKLAVAQEAYFTNPEFVFLNANGKVPDVHDLRRDYQRLLRRADLPTKAPFKALRHAYAYRALASGNFTIHEVSAQLGHSNIKTTMATYGHLYKNRPRDLDRRLKILPRHQEWEKHLVGQVKQPEPLEWGTSAPF